MKILGYFTFLALVIGTMYAISVFTHNNTPSTLSRAAIEPDLLLSTSRTYFMEHAKSRSVTQLRRAIASIIDIEQDLDQDSRAKVNEAVKKLRGIVKDMSQNDFDVDQLNDASIRALNALSYAELKVMEHYVDSHELDKAQLALKYGMMHIKNAMVYSSGKKKEYEIHIYDEMDSLMENGELSNKEIIQKLESMIEDLDNLEDTQTSE